MSWQLPLIGYGVTFLLGLGFSISNENVRTEAAIGGLLCFALFTLLGYYHTAVAFSRARHESAAGWRRHGIGGLLCNLLLMSLALIAGYHTYRAATRPTPPPLQPLESLTVHLPAAKTPVWIDSDPACGTDRTADVDDCWALLAAARFPELAVRGISTVFGNQDGRSAHAFAQQIVPRLFEDSMAGHFDLFVGSVERSDSTWRPTPASQALAVALEREPLTIIALGPLTNIATVIRQRPDLLGRITGIVAVAGKQPGQLFHPGRQWWFHFGDFNVSQDPQAADVVLYSGLRVTLMPFDLATNLTMTATDLQKLDAGDASARWLSKVSRSWLTFWQTTLGQNGFHPFDMLAVAFSALPQYFACKATRARIGFSFLLEPFGMGRDLEIGDDFDGPGVVSCFDVDPSLKDLLLRRLGQGTREPSTGSDQNTGTGNRELEQGSALSAI
jgi:pyrimidine-specific ribonucleoside hydrolase